MKNLLIFLMLCATSFCFADGSLDASDGDVVIPAGSTSYTLTNNEVWKHSKIYFKASPDQTATNIAATLSPGLIVFTANAPATSDVKIHFALGNLRQ